MRGRSRKISWPRRFIVDLMHASNRVPFVSLARPLDVSQLIDARAQVFPAPGWAAIFVKAFALVARDEPALRTLYVKLPWPHFFELPRSVGMVAIARVENGEDCVLPEKIPAADERSLLDIDAQIRRAKDARVEEIPAFRKIRMATNLPFPLRRLSWLIGRNVGRMCANHFGSFGVTSVAAYGPGELQALSPGPFLLSYGVAGPEGKIDVMIRWDHRLMDAAYMMGILTRLERVLNAELAAEILKLRQPFCAKPPQTAPT